jgi:hypothetical protein
VLRLLAGEAAVVEPTAQSSSRVSGPVSDPAEGVRVAGWQLLRKLLLYHLGLGLAVTVLVLAFPASIDYLPVGGISDLAERTGSHLAPRPVPADAQAASVIDGPERTGFEALSQAPRLAVVLIGVWLLMLPVSWLHRGIYRTSNYDHSLDETTLILPGVVAAIVIVVQHSLALAFALAGIAAGVRFRRALQDTFDAQFILVAIGAGIAAGVGALEVAAVLSVFFCYATLYLCSHGDGLHSDYKGRQKAARLAPSTNEEAAPDTTNPGERE